MKEMKRLKYKKLVGKLMEALQELRWKQIKELGLES